MPKQVNEFQKKEILKLFVKGTNIKEIAKIFNFTIPTITRQLKTQLSIEEFNKIKENNSKSDFTNNETQNIAQTNEVKDLSLDKELPKKVIQSKTKEVNNFNDFSYEDISSNNLFVELAPVNCDIDCSSQKDLSSVNISDVNFLKLFT